MIKKTVLLFVEGVDVGVGVGVFPLVGCFVLNATTCGELGEEQLVSKTSKATSIQLNRRLDIFYFFYFFRKAERPDRIIQFDKLIRTGRRGRFIGLLAG